MSQKNDAPVLLFSLLVTLGLLGAGAWWLYKTFIPNSAGTVQPTATTGPSSIEGSPNALPPTTSNLDASNPGQDPLAEFQISVGHVNLFPNTASSEKQAGIEAIANQDYDKAIQQLTASLQANRNDPESQIYLNNAAIAEAPAYTIALAIPSPSAMDVSLELLRGVAHAQRDINQSGGINGTPLKVVIATDNNDETQAQAVAETLSQDPSILGVIGHFSSGISLAAAPVYATNQVVMISATSTSVDLSGSGDYIFRTVQSDRIAGDGLARYMIDQLGTTNVAIFFNSESAYSKSLKSAFSSAVLTGGGRVVSEIDLSKSGFSAAQSVAQVIDQGAEVLMLAANTPTRPQALDVIAANRQRLNLLGGDSLYNADVLKIGQDDALDMVVSAAWHRQANPNTDFPKAAQSLWGGPVSWRTAMAYDATQALAAGIADTGQSPKDITAEKVQQALATPGFDADGATDSIQFLPSGDRMLPPQLVTIEADASAQFGYSFVPVP